MSAWPPSTRAETPSPSAARSSATIISVSCMKYGSPAGPMNVSRCASGIPGSIWSQKARPSDMCSWKRTDPCARSAGSMSRRMVRMMAPSGNADAWAPNGPAAAGPPNKPEPVARPAAASPRPAAPRRRSASRRPIPLRPAVLDAHVSPPPRRDVTAAWRRLSTTLRFERRPNGRRPAPRVAALSWAVGCRTGLTDRAPRGHATCPKEVTWPLE